MPRDGTVEQGTFLSMVPAGAGERRLALWAVLLSVAVFAIAAPYAQVPLARIDAFIPAYQAALFLNDLITAVLLFGQFNILRSRALLVLGCGYLFTAFLVVAHTLSFPGLFAPSGLLGAGPQSTAWLYMFWHGGFPIAVIAYAFLKKPEETAGPGGRPASGAILLGLGVVLLIAVGLTFLSTGGAAVLPPIMQGNSYTPAMIGVVSTVWGLNVLALFVLWRWRPHSVLDVWLMVVVCAWLFDIALSAVLNAGRFDLGFYGGRLYGLLASCFVLLVLLLENGALYARLVRSHREVGAAKAQVEDYARRLEDKVAASEEKYRHFLEQARSAIFAADRNGHVVEANPATELLFGLPRPAIVGRPLEDCVDLSKTPEAREAIARLLSEEGSRVDNMRLTRTDGQEVYVNISSSHVRIDDDLLTLFIARDVTEHAKLEQQFRQSQKMEAIGQLTGGLAHDFNNLLSIVIGNVELLSGRLEEEPDKKNYAELALEAAWRGAELTRQLLAFSRQQPLAPKLTEVNELVSGMSKLLARTLGENIEIKLGLKPHLWPVLVDPAQLSTALANLASNARDAMPEGGTLRFETANVTLDEAYGKANPDVHPGDFAMIAVSDTGGGIQAEILTRVFEPFFTTKPTGKGTGLGLSMVFGFLKQSGGHAKIYSEIGAGTVVRLYLPRAADGAAASEETALPAEAVRPTGGETILVVEDNPGVRLIAIEQLRALGYKALEADGPDAAKAILQGTAPVDLLFTDMVMPGGKNGRELAAEAVTLRPGLKVLFTSGYLGSGLRDSNQLGAGDMLLVKPYSLSELAQKLRLVLDAS